MGMDSEYKFVTSYMTWSLRTVSDKKNIDNYKREVIYY